MGGAEGGLSQTHDVIPKEKNKQTWKLIVQQVGSGRTIKSWLLNMVLKIAQN